jgi:hypothetical protein
MRPHLLVRSLGLLLCCAALVGALAVSPAVAGAAEGEETTTTEPPPVEPPPVTEPPPVETEVPTTPENPTSSPPANSPPVSETPSSEPVHSGGGGGTTTTNAGAPSSDGGSGGQTSSGSTTSTPATTTLGGSTARSHARSHTTRTTAGSGGGGSKGGSGSRGGGATSHSSPSHTAAPSGGGGSTEPVVSTTDVTQGAEAFSHVASHVGEVFAQALPTKPLEDIGAKVLAHTGIVPTKGGKAQKDAVDRIGSALGAALIGSAVAVDRKPPASSPDPITFIVDAPSGKSGTVYQLGILAVLLAAAVVIGREVRKGLGFGKPIMGSVEGARSSWARRQPGDLKASVRLLRDRGRLAARRLRTQAASGLRSMF